MILQTLKITNFRNHKLLELSFSDNINIIYGQNGSGKTNILESIYFLGITKSHRALMDEDLIKRGEEFFKIIGSLKKERLENTYEINFSRNKKEYFIDNDKIKKVSDYISKLNIIIFYPEDLNLIKGAPGIRRKFLDLELSQLYNTYYKVLNDYNKLLKIRNEYLKKLQKKEKIDNNYFEIITEYLINKAIFIYRARNKFINKINEYVGDIYLDIMKIPNFSLKYKTNIELEEYTEIYIKDKLKSKYREDLEKEVKLGTTLYGPHRDDLEFYLDNENLELYGSQGQQRLAVLSVKLAEIEIFKNHTKTNPILLLDDVFSELDDEKKNNLLKYIGTSIQTIITTTDLENIDKKILNSSKLFEVSNGKLISIKGDVKENE